MTPFLCELFVYPVKSLAGIAVQRWPVDKTGLRYDRKWMLIDSDGRFLSQRRLPRMALIQPTIVADQLVLSAPGQTDLAVPLNGGSGQDTPVSIWDDNYPAKTVGIEADAWFSSFLDCECRLVYHPPEQMRQVDPDYAKIGDETAFSDGFPFLLVSDASLATLNSAVGQELSMRRFRPNLVVSGCEAYAEDTWRNIVIGAIPFRLPKPCSRCSVPTIDPDTAEVGKEPLTTLARLRKADNKVYFGQNALHDSLGELAVGDPIAIELSGEAQPLLVG